MAKGQLSGPVVRSAVRALIVEAGKLLTIRMFRGSGDEFRVLPGGGQQHREPLEQTLKRECLEEIGVAPNVGSLAYVREYIGKNHIFHDAHHNFHQLEIVFHCSLPPGVHPTIGSELDRHQIGIDWIPVRELTQHNFYPRIIASFVDGDRIAIEGQYLGDTN